MISRPLITFLALSLAAPVLAKDKDYPTRKTTTDAPTAAAIAAAQEITRQLTSEDPADRDAGLTAIRQYFENDPVRAARNLRTYWLRALTEQKRYQEIADFALASILAMPAESAEVESLQATRVRSLLRAGKTEEALSAAKGLFNVSSMATTSAAMLVIAECLNAAHPKDTTLLERFRSEQIAGAAAPSTQPTTQPTTQPVRSMVLDSIRINAKEYEPLLSRLYGEDFTSLMARGNLLLLSDRAKDAEPIFRRAYGVAPDLLVPAASEAIARCIKAQDGTIGRANAWVLSIRPKPVPPPPPATQPTTAPTTQPTSK